MTEEETVAQTEAPAELRNVSRTEKKARKALAKMGLEPVAGITRVVMRRPKNVRVFVFVLIRFNHAIPGPVCC